MTPTSNHRVKKKSVVISNTKNVGFKTDREVPKGNS